MSDWDRADKHVHPVGHSPGASWLIGIVIGGLIVIMLVVSYTIGWHRGRHSERAAVSQQTEQPSTKGAVSKEKKATASGPGKQLFMQNCGSCHTLAAAGTSGAVGPNLDDLAPDQQIVLSAIENGGTGSGRMPKGLVTGKQAQQVADFVSQSAGGR